MKTRIYTIIRVVCLLLFFVSRLGADPFGRGETIMEDSFHRDDGDDAHLTVEMILIDKNGGKRKRQLEIYTKDYGEYIKSLLRFNAPADIEGTAFLLWENEAKDDTQYLYLPALKRARRIVSSQKSLRFVNTDYTYEDMQRRRPHKDTHSLVRHEDYIGRRCFVIESIPTTQKNSQYTKRIHWVDAESFVVLKTQFFDRKGKLSKCYSVEQFQRRQDIWTTVKTRIEDYKDRHTTIMAVVAVVYNQGLEDRLFNLRALEQE